MTTATTLNPGTANPPSAHRLGQVPFHLLARGTRWWRLLVGSLVLFAAMLAAMDLPKEAIAAIRHGQYGELPVLGPMTAILAGLIGIGLSLPAALAVTRWIGGRPAGTLFSVTARIRWRWLGRCVLVAAPVTVVTDIASVILAAATSTSGHSARAVPHPPLAMASASTFAVVVIVGCGVLLVVTVLALTVVQSATEEVIARGWILQSIGAFTGRVWPAVTIQALIFTALHGFSGTPAGYVSLIVYAVVLGGLAVATGGIEAGIALHACWNGVIALLTVALWATGLLTDTGSTMADSPWQPMLMQLAGFTTYAVLIRQLHHRRSPATALPAVAASGPAPGSRPERRAS